MDLYGRMVESFKKIKLVWIYSRGLISQTQLGGHNCGLGLSKEGFGDDGEALPKV